MRTKIKKQLKVALSLLIIISSINLLAQEKVPKSVQEMSIGVGYNSGWLKDLNFSPIHYTQGGVILGFDYRKTKIVTGNKLLVHLDYGSGKINTPVGDFLSTETVLGNASVIWLKNTNLFNKEKLNLLLGGNYHFFFHYLEYDGQSAFSFFGNHSVDISGQLEYDISEKAKLHFGLSIPVFNLIVRPPYNSLDFETEEAGPIKLITNGHLGSFNNLLAYDLQVRYTRQLNERFKFDLIYFNRFQYLNDDDLLRQVQNQISAGIVFQF